MTQRLPRLFWVLFVGTFLNRVGSFVIPLFAIYLTAQRGYSPTRAGVICSLWGLGSFCSGLLGGQLADRLGRKRTMLLGLGWGALAMLLVPLANGVVVLGLAAFQLGLAGDLYRPAIHAQLADVCPPSLRPRAYGLLYWAINLGFAVATSVGGALAYKGFGMLFVADAVTTLAFGAIVLALVPETKPARVEHEEHGRLRDAFTDGVLLRFAFVQILTGLVFAQAQAALPIALLRHGMGPAQYGLVMAENGVLIVILQPLWVRFVNRFRRTRVIAAGALLVGLGFAWNVLPLGIVGAAMSVMIWTVGEILTSPIIPALTADLAPPRLRGRYQGVMQMSFGTCALIGPTGGMAILEHAGATALWSTCLGLGALAAIVILASAPRLRERLAGRGAPA